MIHLLVEELHLMFSAWPFSQWGFDIVGPLKCEPKNKWFLLATTNYFPKWIKFNAPAIITAPDARMFIAKDIICRFGLTDIIISDNGFQFDAEEITALCSIFGINYNLSTPYHL